jgi:hypothetical protein
VDAWCLEILAADPKLKMLDEEGILVEFWGLGEGKGSGLKNSN